MNSQKRWKERYRKFAQLHSVRGRKVMRSNMRRFTREAALERKLEAAQRRIGALESEIDLLHEESAAIDEYFDPGGYLESRKPEIMA